MRDREGELYGFTIDDTIYLTEKGFNEQTMVHEFTHVWARAMQYGNPEGWQQMGMPFKPQDLDAIHDKFQLPELAGRYFTKALTESNAQTEGMKR